MYIPFHAFEKFSTASACSQCYPLYPESRNPLSFVASVGHHLSSVFASIMSRIPKSHLQQIYIGTQLQCFHLCAHSHQLHQLILHTLTYAWQPCIFEVMIDLLYLKHQTSVRNMDQQSRELPQYGEKHVFSFVGMSQLCIPD